MSNEETEISVTPKLNEVKIEKVIDNDLIDEANVESNDKLPDTLEVETKISSSDSAYEQEINRLRELIAVKNAENQNLEVKLNECEQLARNQIEQLNQNFTLKLEQTLKKFQEGHKDKTSSLVMKYAEGEKKCIDLNRNIEFLQSKLNTAAKENKYLIEKFEKSKNETDKLNSEFEKKIQEIMGIKKDYEKLKENFVLSEAKEKASMMKLKSEIESHVVTRKSLEQANTEIERLKKQIEDNESFNDSKKSDDESDEIKKLDEDQQVILNDSLTSMVTEVQAEKAVKSSTPILGEITQRELSALKSQLKDMFEERTTLRDRLQCMDQERKLQEASISKYKETLQSQKQMNKDLLNEIIQLRELQETLTKEKSEKTQLDHRLKILSAELSDLQAELNLSKEKQNELLEFTSKLTEKNTQLQTENFSSKEKLQNIQEELENVTKNLNESNLSFKIELESLNENLKELKEKNHELSTGLKEKTKQVEELTIKLSDEQDENNSLKKKHAANIKDLTRQLQSFQKKMNSQTTLTAANNSSSVLIQPVPSASSSNHSLHKATSLTFRQNSRKNSLSSLNDKDLMDLTCSTTAGDEDSRSSTDSTQVTTITPSQTNTHYGEVICGGSADDVYVVDIDKQKVIEKIVKLQKLLAKRNEKIDFLQDHVNQLTNDIKRKTKIIQAYAINEDVGAFTSEAQDSIKREMSRKTGIMSSLYKSNKSYIQTTQYINSNESNMTKELCLEINSKLQALLEDTLIKNITLKESLETLGQEIARLSQENRQIKINQQ